MNIKHIVAATALSFALVAPAFAQDAAAPAPSSTPAASDSSAMGGTDAMGKKHKAPHMKKAKKAKAPKADAMAPTAK